MLNGAKSRLRNSPGDDGDGQQQRSSSRRPRTCRSCSGACGSFSASRACFDLPPARQAGMAIAFRHGYDGAAHDRQCAGNASKSMSSGRSTDLFASEPDRLSRLSLRGRGHLFRLVEDASRPAAARTRSPRLPRRRTSRHARDALFAGEIVNPTEGRAAEHLAERGSGAPEAVDLAAARRAADARAGRRDRGGRVRRRHRHPPHRHRRLGARAGAAGRCARARRSPRLQVSFLSNIDGAAFDEAVEALDPATTLVVVASKTFTTAETLANWPRRSPG